MIGRVESLAQEEFELPGAKASIPSCREGDCEVGFKINMQKMRSSGRCMPGTLLKAKNHGK